MDIELGRPDLGKGNVCREQEGAQEDLRRARQHGLACPARDVESLHVGHDGAAGAFDAYARDVVMGRRAAVLDEDGVPAVGKRQGGGRALHVPDAVGEVDEGGEARVTVGACVEAVDVEAVVG